MQVVHHQPPPPTLSNYLLHTVGTTKFDALIQSIDTPQFHATAIKHNFTKILIQKGTGSYIPTKHTSITHSINVEVTTILPNFETVISHSGAVSSSNVSNTRKK